MKIFAVLLLTFIYAAVHAQDTLFMRGTDPVVASVQEIEEEDDGFVIIQKILKGKTVKEKLKKNTIKAIRLRNGILDKYKADKYTYVDKLQMINSKVIYCTVIEIGDDSVTIDTDNILRAVSIPKDSIASIIHPNGRKEPYNELAVSKEGIPENEDTEIGTPVEKIDSAKVSRFASKLKALNDEMVDAKGDMENIKRLFERFVKDEKYMSSGYDSLRGEIILEYCRVWDKSYFTGQLRNDLPDGKGELFKPNGEIQSGEFVDGKLYGKGTIKKNGMLQKEGIFRNGLLNGDGVIIDGRGTIFAGTFVDDLLLGNGSIAYKNGNYENGLYSRHRLFGDGERHFPDSNFYKGSFNNGKFHGFGNYTWAVSNISYSGSFREGKRNGQGVLTLPDDIIISGEWKNDCPEGEITIKKQSEKPGDFYSASWQVKDCKIESKKGNTKKIKFDENLLFIKMTR